MIFLDGVIAILAGVVCGIAAFATYGRGSGRVFGLSATLCVFLVVAGIITAIFGAGMWFATPHTIHIG